MAEPSYTMHPQSVSSSSPPPHPHNHDQSDLTNTPRCLNQLPLNPNDYWLEHYDRPSNQTPRRPKPKRLPSLAPYTSKWKSKYTNPKTRDGLLAKLKSAFESDYGSGVQNYYGGYPMGGMGYGMGGMGMGGMGMYPGMGMGGMGMGGMGGMYPGMMGGMGGMGMGMGGMGGYGVSGVS